MSTAQEIRATLEPVLTPLGLVVEDVSVSPAGKRRLVRVLVDSDISSLDVADTSSTVPPLSLDAVADATRAVSDELDASDVMGAAPYVLEVSAARKTAARTVTLDLDTVQRGTVQVEFTRPAAGDAGGDTPEDTSEDI